MLAQAEQGLSLDPNDPAAHHQRQQEQPPPPQQQTLQQMHRPDQR
jgi:hypothetical protein